MGAGLFHEHGHASSSTARDWTTFQGIAASALSPGIRGSSTVQALLLERLDPSLSAERMQSPYGATAAHPEPYPGTTHLSRMLAHPPAHLLTATSFADVCSDARLSPAPVLVPSLGRLPTPNAQPSPCVGASLLMEAIPPGHFYGRGLRMTTSRAAHADQP